MVDVPLRVVILWVRIEFSRHAAEYFELQHLARPHVVAFRPPLQERAGIAALRQRRCGLSSSLPFHSSILRLHVEKVWSKVCAFSEVSTAAPAAGPPL